MRGGSGYADSKSGARRIEFLILMRKQRIALPLLYLVLIPALSYAQSINAQPSDTSAILQNFRNATVGWVRQAESVATNVFGILAGIEFAIAVGLLVLQSADLVTWSAAITRKLLALGGFYALLLYGPTWMQWILDSYTQFGSQASGVPAITAGDIMADGLDIVSTLLITAAAANFLDILLALTCVACSIAIFWSYWRLVKAFVIAKIESYFTISAAAIQLGWGASRFTQTYAERYIASAFATGVKLMCFYLIIGIGRTFSPGWLQQASLVTAATSGITNLLTLTTSIVMFCALADVDKMAAAIFGGSPQFTGHDVTNTYSPVVNAGMSAASFAVGIATSGVGTAIGGAAGAMFAGARGAAGAAAGAASSTGNAAWRGFAMPISIGSGSVARSSESVAPPRIGGDTGPKLLPPPKS